MVRFISNVIIAAVSLIVVVSAFMNFEYVSGRVETELYGMILGAVSVAFDVIKAFLPLIIVWALTHKNYFPALIASLLFAPLVVFSLLSAFGFAASNINAASTGKANVTEQYTDIKDDISRAKDKLVAQPEARGIGVVQQAIMAAQQHKRFTSSKQCTDATARKSKNFCADYFNLQAELAASKKRGSLEATLKSLKAQKVALLAKGAKRDVDPQAGMIAQLTGFKIKDVQTGIAAFLAVIIEAVAAFGFYIATSHGAFDKAGKAVRTKKAANTNEPELTKEALDEMATLQVRTLDSIAAEAAPAPLRVVDGDTPRKPLTLQDTQARPRRLTVKANGALSVV